MQAIGDVINKIVKKRNLGSQDELYSRVIKYPAIQDFLRANKAKIDKQIVKNSLPNLFEFYSQITKADKVMTGYRPELFLNGKVIDVRYVPTDKKVAADQAKAVKRNLELIDLPQRLHDIKLSQVDVTPERSQALKFIDNFVKTYPTKPSQQGLYLVGDFGIGKTYILAGLANKVAEQGKKVIFLHVPTFIAGLTSHFEDNSLQKEIQRVANCDLLILDDIGAESLSQWSRDDVLGVILQARMDNALPTFFSSNLDMEKLEAHFAETRNAIDPVKAARLMQRIRFLAKEIVISGPNRRKF